jgi:hypothetical protein
LRFDIKKSSYLSIAMPLLTPDQIFDQMISKLGPLTAEEIAARKRQYTHHIGKVIRREERRENRRKNDEDEDGDIKKVKRVVFLDTSSTKPKYAGIREKEDSMFYRD